jgi:hypothetical protein
MKVLDIIGLMALWFMFLWFTGASVISFITWTNVFILGLSDWHIFWRALLLVLTLLGYIILTHNHTK